MRPNFPQPLTPASKLFASHTLRPTPWSLIKRYEQVDGRAKQRYQEHSKHTHLRSTEHTPEHHAGNGESVAGASPLKVNTFTIMCAFLLCKARPDVVTCIFLTCWQRFLFQGTLGSRVQRWQEDHKSSEFAKATLLTGVTYMPRLQMWNLSMIAFCSTKS